MRVFLQNYYLLFKAGHIIFFICWMAGLFYLPRLFYYHASHLSDPKMSSVFSTMERRLLKIIMNPSQILTYVFGLLLLFTAGNFSSLGGWFHVKFTCVLLLSFFHGLCSRWHRQLSNNISPYPENTYRFLNEIPGILLIIIVFMVVFKPF